VVANIGADQWEAVRESIRIAGDRFTALITSASDANAKVTAHWSLAEMAAHVTGIALMYTTMVRPEATMALPALKEAISATTVDTVSVLNEKALEQFTERDAQALAAQLRAHIDEILATSERQDPERLIPWLGDSQVPLAGILAHLVNELLIHGRDIALALNRPWVIPPKDAALFFELFLVGMIRHDHGRLVEGGAEPTDRRIAVEFRSRYTKPVTLVLKFGRVSVEDPRPDNDIRLFFDPPTLNLTLFHRMTNARAALTGKLVLWGRRPWLIVPFLRKVRLP
jgi:uncharacterized protein (TIGR03083 family)